MGIGRLELSKELIALVCGCVMEEEHNGQQYQGLHNMGTRLVYVPSDVPVPQHLKDPSAAEDAEREARGVAIDLSRKSSEEAINEWKLREDLIINDLTTRMDQPIELEGKQFPAPTNICCRYL